MFVYHGIPRGTDYSHSACGEKKECVNILLLVNRSLENVFKIVS